MVTGGRGTNVQAVLLNPNRVQSQGEEIASSRSGTMKKIIETIAQALVDQPDRVSCPSTATTTGGYASCISFKQGEQESI